MKPTPAPARTRVTPRKKSVNRSLAQRARRQRTMRARGRA